MKSLSLFLLLVLPISSWCSDNIRFALSYKNHPLTYGTEGGRAEGIFSSLISFIDSKISNYQFDVRAYNWQRAQALVHSGERDAYCTYPSDERKKFSLFTKNPLFVQDYGYIIFNKNNKNASNILKIKSLKDLEQFKFLSQSGVKWEEDNVPQKIDRIYVNSIEQLSHYLFLRNEGDFFIMPPEQVHYYAKMFGYLDKVGILKVNFIPNSLVNYHIGISLKHPKHKELIKLIDNKINTAEFEKFRDEIQGQFK